MTPLTTIVDGKRLEGRTLRKMRERIIRSFMDVIILARLRDNPLSGYDVISLIRSRFSLLISSGTVYSLLYSLERNGLIEGTWNERRRVYRLTDKGLRTISMILSANGTISKFITDLLEVQAIT